MGLFDTVTVGAGMVSITCCTCGITYHAPEDWVSARRNKHDSFYCPNGHSLVFGGKSEADKLRDQLAREQHRTEQAQADAETQRRRLTVANRRISAHKGIATKLRKRVASGQCPCCSRKFKDLADHMRAQHPDWNPETGAEAIAAKVGQ